MHIFRAVKKVPGGLMLVPLLLGALCHTFTPGAGKYFGSFTNGYSPHLIRMVLLHGRQHQLQKRWTGIA